MQNDAGDLFQARGLVRFYTRHFAFICDPEREAPKLSLCNDIKKGK